MKQLPSCYYAWLCALLIIFGSKGTAPNESVKWLGQSDTATDSHTLINHLKLNTMSQKTVIKLRITIDQSHLGYYGRGEMVITDMMFSYYDNYLMDADQLIAEVKQCIKLMKGFTMLTISLTDDFSYSIYPREVNSVRFTSYYGELKMSHSNGSYFDNWNDAKIKDVYDNIRTFVKNANIFQLGKLKQSDSTEVATA